MASNTLELARSPSVSSTSTVGSTSSTGELIRRLSVHNNLDTLTDTNSQPSKPLMATNSEGANGLSVSSGTIEPVSVLPKPAIKRKPIKFTVRKVSHEPVNTPPPEASTGGHGHSRQSSASSSYTHTHHQQHQRQPSDTTKLAPGRVLASSQEKYDQYTSRIDKINKEIDFLNNLLPPFNVEIDYNTRTKIVRAIEKLRTKQDELSKKKYSLGITISRLWREQDAGTMWVRSVSD